MIERAGLHTCRHIAYIRQREYAHILADRAELERVLRQGAEKARQLAARTLAKVYKKVGFV